MSVAKKILRSPPIVSLLVGSVVFLSLLGLRSLGSLEYLELAVFDWFIRLRPEASMADPRIALIKITENDIQAQGQWPLSDVSLARVLATLIDYKPRAIGLDIYRDVPVPPVGDKLERILLETPYIVTVMSCVGDKARGVDPPLVLRNTNQVGFNDIVVDPGGIVRRGLLFLDDGHTVFYSFALRLALLYLQEDSVSPRPDPFNPEYIRLGQTTIRPFCGNDGGYVNADARGYQFLLDWKSYKNGLPSYSLTSLLSREVEPRYLKNKMVIIGVKAESVKDYFYTPFSRGRRASQEIAGSELHAHITSQLVRLALEGDAPIATLSERQEGYWILLWSLLGSIVCFWGRTPWRFSFAAGSGLLVLGLIAYTAFLRDCWIPVVPPAMTWIISASVTTAYVSQSERKQRALLMRLFAVHVSPEVADVIWRERDQILEEGQPRTQKLIATVMFADLQGFSRISEKTTPQTLMEWLNNYMGVMTQVVMAHGGVVDDYAGDSLKANFGVPLARTTEAEIRQDAVNAVNCALAMEKEMKRLNKVLWEQNSPTVGMRIGVFTGPIVAGGVGSSQRLKYTTVGDTVNIASRLESYDKEGFHPDSTHSPCRILIGESTLRYLGDRFEARQIGEVTLRGREQKIVAYRIISE